VPVAIFLASLRAVACVFMSHRHFFLFFFFFSLQRLIFVPQDDSDDDDDDEDDDGGNQDDGSSSSSSSSDDNDSTAAAHAAAIGHSPQPIRPTVTVPRSDPHSYANAAGSPAKIAAATPNTAGAAAVATPGKESAAAGTPDTDNDKPSPMETNSPEDEGDSKQSNKDVTPNNDKQTNGLEGGSHHSKASSNEKKKKLKFYCPHNLNERDADENTPIHIAIHSRKIEHVKLLLEAGANVHKKSDGSAPIHTAISIAALQQHEHFGYDCLVLLSKHDVDLSAKDDAMHTPLYLACKFNLPSIVTFLLSTDAGMSTLNTKADRSGGRPLHAAAKFDTMSKPLGSRSAAGTAASMGRHVSHRHPDGTITNSVHHIPGFPGKQAPAHVKEGEPSASNPNPALAGLSGEAMLTQLLLRTEGIEVDAINTVGQTPLHIACMRGNWVVARLLMQAGSDPNIADRRGFTAGQLAHKRGMPIPIDLINALGGPPSSGTVAPPRDLIVDPDQNTLVLAHELCVLHRSCPPIVRDASTEPPPENVRRLQVLLDQDTGILRGGEFGRCVWEGEARRAAMVDILKVRHALLFTYERSKGLQLFLQIF